MLLPRLSSHDALQIVFDDRLISAMTAKGEIALGGDAFLIANPGDVDRDPIGCEPGSNNTHRHSSNAIDAGLRELTADDQGSGCRSGHGAGCWLRLRHCAMRSPAETIGVNPSARSSPMIGKEHDAGRTSPSSRSCSAIDRLDGAHRLGSTPKICAR
jgi:hypothetical protein